jgi:hypothetical protein
MRFKTGVKIYTFEETTGIRSRVLSIFSENNEVVLGDFRFSQLFFLTWCCKWAQMVHLVKSYSAITLRFSDGPYESNFLKVAGTLTFYV